MLVGTRPACSSNPPFPANLLKLLTQTGSKQTDYLRTDKGGHLDLVDCLVYANLNLRWHEVPGQGAHVDPNSLKQGQVDLGHARPAATFQSGIIHRPSGL